MLFRYTLSRRDAVLIVLGALLMHILNIFSPQSDSAFDTTDTAKDASSPPRTTSSPANPVRCESQRTIPKAGRPPSNAVHLPVELNANLPETTMVSHAPGWTIFRNLYMAEGTLFVVSSYPRSYFPHIRYITSTGLPASNSEENIRSREPTRDNMDFLSPEEAKRRWGGDFAAGERNRVREIEGATFLINDPSQFLRHYYHFVAELLFGAWAFWSGTFNQSPFPFPSLSDYYLTHANVTPAFDRFIFVHADADGWRDDPNFNSYFLRAAFPSLTVEHVEDWEDRIRTTSPPSMQFNMARAEDPRALEETMREARMSDRAWIMPLVLLADRSASFRGETCGSRTQRTASEALDAMQEAGRLAKDWWEPVRLAVARFAGAEDPRSITPDDVGKTADTGMPQKIVITYIMRQGSRRRLIAEDHDGLVAALQDLVQRKAKEGGREWELNVVKAEDLSKDAQVRLAAKTTIMLGVHGNGLTHLVLMHPTPLSAVIEIFYPGGFAHDYEWTARALGMKHFAIWNDTHYAYPNELGVHYPDGFQGSSIPVYGPAVAQLIEDRVAGKL